MHVRGRKKRAPVGHLAACLALCCQGSGPEHCSIRSSWNYGVIRMATSGERSPLWPGTVGHSLSPEWI